MRVEGREDGSVGSWRGVCTKEEDEVKEVELSEDLVVET